MKDISKKRHIAKTITWRLIATGTTIILAWIISGDPMIGLHVGFWEFFSQSTHNPQKVYKAIKKAGNPVKYRQAVGEIIAAQKRTVSR